MDIQKQRIIEISDEILNFLLKYKESHPGFTFALRTRDSTKSKESRLKNGMWFQGSDYIYVPFFNKGDDARKIKTIGFVLEFDSDGSITKNNITISFKDGNFSKKDIQFHEDVAKLFNAQITDNLGTFEFDNTQNYLSNLELFLNDYWPKIIELLEKNGLSEDKRYIISEQEFQKNLKRIMAIKKNISKSSFGIEDSEVQSIIDLLLFKKQIILQGPPGTGKTYTAEKIAKLLTSDINASEKLTAETIKKNLSVGQKIANSSGKENFYTVRNIDDNGVELQSEKSQPWKPNYDKIISKYNELVLGKKPKNTNALDPYELAIAKYFFKTNKPSTTTKRGEYKIVQFHPSISYEDFVRGIVAKVEDGKVIYETENKLFGSYAKKALDNLNAVNKDVKQFSKEQHIENLLQEFAENIQKEIDENESFPITKHVHIRNVEDDAFRYNGDWKSSQRMKFKDLVLAQINDVTTRQGIKKLPGVSGLAKQHASYFVKVLNMFQEEFKNELSKSPSSHITKPDLKNYILIIDEINRANLPSVLGELIYALEYRNKPVETIYEIDGDNTITIPDNLYIIGTMNTADRSVGHIDYAIKRRFAFASLLPSKDVISNVKAQELFEKVRSLFIKEIDEEYQPSEYLASDFDYKDIQIGHSYFMLSGGDEQEQSKELRMRLDYEIIPLLREYVKDGLLLETATELINELETFEC